VDLTDLQWKIVEPLLPSPKPAGSPGRPPVKYRQVLNAILWILKTGARWKDLPGRYPSYQTCHRYFQTWVRERVFAQILMRLAQDLEERGKIDLSECFVDATFVKGKRGAKRLAPLKQGRVSRSWQSQTLEVYLLPYPYFALRRMKSPWLRPRLKRGLPGSYLRNSLVTGRMTVTSSMKRWPPRR
jgi:transposase